MNKTIFVTMFQQLLYVTGRIGLAKLWKFTLGALEDIESAPVTDGEKRESVIADVMVAAKALEFELEENIIRILVAVAVEYRSLIAAGKIDSKGQRIKPPSV